MIGLADIGESKRKQETADFIVTISNTAPNCPNHIYTAYIPKARRGRVGTKKYLIRIEGRFKEIPRGVYDQLAQETEEIDYTLQDIDRMVAEFERQQASINNMVQQKVQSQKLPQGTPFGTGPNPFAMP